MWVLALLILVSNVTAMDWDNVKDYNSEEKIITVTNALGLGGTI